MLLAACRCDQPRPCAGSVPSDCPRAEACHCALAVEEPTQGNSVAHVSGYCAVSVWAMVMHCHQGSLMQAVHPQDAIFLAFPCSDTYTPAHACLNPKPLMCGHPRQAMHTLDAFVVGFPGAVPSYSSTLLSGDDTPQSHAGSAYMGCLPAGMAWAYHTCSSTGRSELICHIPIQAVRYDAVDEGVTQELKQGKPMQGFPHLLQHTPI